ncbi:Kinesin-like protein KIN-10A [Sesamum alatum]|uniref:Kinesin-like protein KIN-10A n=1 Tax=Sesamum alatum TaxID=300844 RepID=A0AAE1Y2A6_9LAMI|nr:Kinesin-like protein KIN-10A [Sesamum alatum]
MEERMYQREVEMLRQCLEDIESELILSRVGARSGSVDVEGGGFMTRLLEACSEDSDMVNKAFLTTVYEEEESENEDEYKNDLFDDESSNDGELSNENPEDDAVLSRQMRIQNIFTQCGNYRELSQHKSTPMPAKKRKTDSMTDPSTINSEDSTSRMNLREQDFGKNMKENHNPISETSNDIEVYVKWDASKENPEKFITTLKVLKDSTLADLRKLIEIHLVVDQKAFTILRVLQVPKETTTQTSKLPICNNQLRGRLACLRPVKAMQRPNHQLFSPLENKLLPTAPNSHFTKKGNECF